MSNTNNPRRNQTSVRWQLLVTVSTAALLASAYGAGEAEAAGNDSDRPLIWIELGGQMESQNNWQEPFSPPFMASITQPKMLSALDVQRPPAHALATERSITFQPESSDWVFSASIRYGRSQATRHHHQQTVNAKIPSNITFSSYRGYPLGGQYQTHNVKYPTQERFADGSANQSERHLVLDFQAGKDVGLGLFGARGSSVLSAGLRFAQFSSKADVKLYARPDLEIPTKPITSIPGLVAFKYNPMHYHHFSGMANNQRSFHGVGPSLAWNGSMPFAGNTDSGELTVDWGTNAALLFGRQKASGHHKTISQYFSGTGKYSVGPGGGRRWMARNERGLRVGGWYNPVVAQTINTKDFNRTRSVTAPNLGGFAGISFRYTDAKISLGYRADFFFGAYDGGIDTRKSTTRGFYGPFASISIGFP